MNRTDFIVLLPCYYSISRFPSPVDTGSLHSARQSVAADCRPVHRRKASCEHALCFGPGQLRPALNEIVATCSSCWKTMKGVVLAGALAAILSFQNVSSINPMENELDSYTGPGEGPSLHPNPKAPASELPNEIDIIKLMNVSSKDQGVSLVEGPIGKFPAYKFRLPYGNVPLPNSAIVTQAMNSSNGFTAVFLFRQQKNNLGTLISVNSPGRLTPWFQIASNSKIGTISMKYRIQGSNRIRLIDWGLPRYNRKSPLAVWTWMSISMDYHSNTVRLDLDCYPSAFDSLNADEGATKIGMPEDALVYFRQEPGLKKKFLGSMQVAKILPYVTHYRMWSCLHISANLPADHRKPLVK